MYSIASASSGICVSYLIVTFQPPSNGTCCYSGVDREVATSGLIQINFTTTVNNSLLLYNPPLDGVDFFLAGINEGGYLEFV